MHSLKWTSSCPFSHKSSVVYHLPRPKGDQEFPASLCLFIFVTLPLRVSRFVQLAGPECGPARIEKYAVYKNVICKVVEV